MSLGTGLDSNLSELRRRPSVSKLEGVLANNNLPTLDSTDHRTGRSCRTSSLALPGPNERALLDLLVREQPLLQPVNVSQLAPTTPLPRRHSAHCCPPERTSSMVSSQPPPLPLRPPAVPERTKPGPPPPLSSIQRYNPSAPPYPPPIPPPYVPKHPKAPHPTTQIPPSPKLKTKIPPPLPPQQQSLSKPTSIHQQNKPNLNHQNMTQIPQQPPPPRIPKALQPPPPPPPISHNQSHQQQTAALPSRTPANVDEQQQQTMNQQQSINNNNNNNNNNSGSKISVRQDSNVSSDSFSQNSSPSYTTKTMETPLLPHHGNAKAASGQYPGHDDGRGGKGGTKGALGGGDSTVSTATTASSGANSSAALTKSVSTPASLQTIVRFHHGSNMSLHHRIIRDMRRPSAHYITRGRLRFRFAQVLINAVALLAIAGGLAAYFRAYPSTVRYVNTSVTTPVVPTPPENPAPGICLPVIVSFCHYHRVPYNFTMFPNYMGHFTQRDAQQELEVYDAVVDVRCYELAALFLCSVFVPKCGPTGQLVRPCRSLCSETKRRCGFFLEVFSLSLPDYLECSLFPESPDTDVCVGHQEVIEAELRAQKPACIAGFQCDTKRCIPADWRCDGHLDCEDRTDELNCHKCEKEGMIHCGEKRCMSQTHVCDGIIHCPWGQDERNCLRLSDRMGDEGHGKLELFHPELQDWKPACITNWDQQSSPRSICGLLGYASANKSMPNNNNNNNIISSSGGNTPAVRKMHQLKQSTLLKELRSCPVDKYPAVELSCTHYICGKGRHYNQRPSTRIIGGVESSPGDWPFLAALLGGPEEIFYCAGVLIADQWVLTASHCVGNFSQSEPSGWTIQLGNTRRHAHSYFSQKMKVRRVVAHPMYNLGVAHDNDVALFQLKSRVSFHDHLLPVCLPPPNHELVPGTVCTVIGWGKKEDRDASEYEPAVNEVQVPVLNRELCNSWLEHRDLNVTEGMICAGYPEGGKDACQGDSGGPLLCRDEKHHDRWFVGGIVSWGIKCAHPHLPGVYAYVPRYVPWIKQQMALYSD